MDISANHAVRVARMNLSTKNAFQKIQIQLILIVPPARSASPQLKFHKGNRIPSHVMDHKQNQMLPAYHVSSVLLVNIRIRDVNQMTFLIHQFVRNALDAFLGIL